MKKENEAICILDIAKRVVVAYEEKREVDIDENWGGTGNKKRIIYSGRCPFDNTVCTVAVIVNRETGELIGSPEINTSSDLCDKT